MFYSFPLVGEDVQLAFIAEVAGAEALEEETDPTGRAVPGGVRGSLGLRAFLGTGTAPGALAGALPPAAPRIAQGLHRPAGGVHASSGG